MKSLRTLNRYLYKYRLQLGLGVFFVILSVIFKLFPARYVRQSFDIAEEAIGRYRSSNGEFGLGELRSELITYGLLIIGASLLSGLFMFFMRQTIIVVSRHIEYDLKNTIFDQYQKLTLAFYKRNNTGDLMNRISEDVSRVRMYVGPALMYTVNVAISLIIIISIMFSINVRLTLYVLAPLPVLSIIIYYISKMINIKSEQVQRQLSAISTYVQEAFSGIRVLKSYVREESSSQGFEKASQTYFEKNKELFTINAWFFPMMILLIGLSTTLVIFIGGQEAIKGNITAGNIAEFIIYVNYLTWPMASIGWVTSLVQQAAASQERINEFLHITPEIQNNNQQPMDIKGGLTFDKVSFRYPDTGIQALSEVSFEVKPGSSVAIVGKTGAGKSTIAALVGRLYDADEGQIRIDGQPIEAVNLFALRQAIGYVPQEAFLFSDSIAQNIGFADDGAVFERIEKAARNAEVHANILDFPERYETRVGERGITLSGGQKQRVSIARAIMSEPKILIFDDCLSAVDTETEENILNNLKEVIQKRTTLIISHRVSSVKNADEIIVLEDGKIVERGNHDELMKKEGYYRNMYDNQMKKEETAASTGSNS